MIRILTDSSADLPAGLQDNPIVDIIPLKVVTTDRTYLDRVDLTTEEFLHLLQTSDVLPTTSQPSAGEFVAKYTEMLDGGATEILSIHISSKLSGTISSAHAAQAELPEVPITVFDSLSTSAGIGLLVQQAVKALEEGQSLPEVLRLLESMRDALTIGFVVDTLEYLQKGGRIGKASALMGSILNVKPVLALVNGEIVPLDKARSKRKGLERAMNYIGEKIGGSTPMVAAVLHLAAREEAESVLNAMREQFDCADSYVAELSPVIGTHVGPGVIGIAACPVC